MYFLNGYVYGGEPAQMAKVLDVKVLDDKMLLLTFATGEKRIFDATLLSGGVFQQLDNPEIFNNPKVDGGVVTWADGDIDCAPEYMYEHSYEYTQHDYA